MASSSPAPATSKQRNSRSSSARGQTSQDSASQVQVHLFDEQDEDEDTEDIEFRLMNKPKTSQKQDFIGYSHGDEISSGGSSSGRRRKSNLSRSKQDGNLGDKDSIRDGDPHISQSVSGQKYHIDNHDPYEQQRQQQVVYNSAYDSMSTILEVDSEASQVSDTASERPRDLGTPLEVKTSIDAHRDDFTRFAHKDWGKSRKSGDGHSPVDGVSPDDKFGGTLSALAAQMERLKSRASNDQSNSGAGSRPETHQSSSGSTSTSSSTPQHSRSNSAQTPDGDRQQLMTASASSTPIIGLATAATSPLSPILSLSEKKTNRQQQLQSNSRATSAESLMMISVSPVDTPKIKLPPTRRIAERPVVEVSNKSTITTIDLSLMDKMMEKYFVEHSERATQTIEFDCDDDEFNTIDMNPNNTKKQRTSGASRVQTKNIAVGTEKFSRERFSLLPQTKTRSTQTKPNMNDTDIGTSETRRYKMSHLTDMGKITMRNASKDHEFTQVSSDQEISILGETATIQQENRVKANVESDKTSQAIKSLPSIHSSANLRQQISPKQESKSNETKDSSQIESEQQDEDTDSIQSDNPSTSSQTFGRSLDDSLNLEEDKQVAVSKKVSQTSPIPSSDQKSSNLLDKRASKAPTKKVDKPSSVEISSSKENSNSPSKMQAIPSLKTELRVIIEFANMNNKKRSELTSNSQLIDGKLSKKTEVSTSRHVAASPRQVIDKLNTAGQRHSLLYQQQPNSSRSGNSLDKLISTSAANTSTAANLRTPKQPSYAQQSSSLDNWVEVSKSTVCNEIETDTRHRQTSKSAVKYNQNDDLIMSSNATIRHLPDNKDAVELRSRAARRYYSGDSNVPVGERLLVESEAGFNENQQMIGGDPILTPLSQDVVRKGKVESPIAQAEKKLVRSSSHDLNIDKDIVKQMQVIPPTAAKNKGPLDAAQSSHKPSQNIESSNRTRHQQQQKSDTGLRELHQPRHMAKYSKLRLISPQIERLSRTPSLSSPRLQINEEIEEDKEDRHQITRGGKLVYDDRLREHRHEFRQSPVGATPSPSLRDRQSKHQEPKPYHELVKERRTISPMAADSSSKVNEQYAKNRQQQRMEQRQQMHILKPVTISSPVSPPVLFVDQISNMSSDPETMDSGFVQSGAGSSGNITQRHHHPADQASLLRTRKNSIENLLAFTSQSAPSSPMQRLPTRRDGGEKNLKNATQQQTKVEPMKHYKARHLINSTDDLDDTNGLAFVDDDGDDDALIEQLGNGGGSIRNNRAHKVPAAKSRLLPLPPLEFRNIDTGGPSSRKQSPIIKSATKQRSVSVPKLSADLIVAKGAPADTKDTQLTTRLTRCKFKKESHSLKPKRRTLTKFEQDLIAPHLTGANEIVTPGTEENPRHKVSFAKNGQHEGKYRFRSQIIFESDTDSAADRLSVASSKSGPHSSRAQQRQLHLTATRSNKKELVTETKYSQTNCDNKVDTLKKIRNNQSNSAGESARVIGNNFSGPVPNWDYSLRVNRMRGNRIDSKVK